MLTQEKLKELLEYRDGKLFWIVDKSRLAKKGQEAGYSDYCPKGDNFRWKIRIDRKLYLRSRLVWLYHKGEFPSKMIDHINKPTTDDRIENLREATHAENQRNRAQNKNNKSGYKGIWFRSDSNKWRAAIMVDRKVIGLGTYLKKEDAYKAYCEAAKKYHGEFANVG